MRERKHYAVVGLGETGWSCVKYLQSKNALVDVFDSRTNPPYLKLCQEMFPQVRVIAGRLSYDDFSSVTHVVMSPGVDLRNPFWLALKNKKVFLSDYDLWVSEQPAKKIIGVTGTNGKSTVTDLIAHMGRVSGLNSIAVGNIGLPVLDTLDDGPYDLAVVECSSFQLDLSQPIAWDAAIFLNISDDHMDRYDTWCDYLCAKKKVYKSCSCAVIDADQENLWRDCSFNKNISYSIKNDQADLFFDGDTYFLPNNMHIKASDICLSLQKFPQNVMAALSAASALNLSMQSCFGALKTFKALPYRLDFVGHFSGVRWYNDSKATNIGAAVAAILQVYKDTLGQVIWIAGGQGKGADFSVMTDAIEKHIDMVILYGEDALSIARCIHETPVLLVSSLGQAIEKAHVLANKDDSVLFSPACASFDAFKDFEDRGAFFNKKLTSLTFHELL